MRNPINSRENLAVDGANAAPASFAQFVLASRDQLLRALRSHLSPDIAADVLADAYAYAWAHWSRIAELENPTAYVYRVAERCGYRMESTKRLGSSVSIGFSVDEADAEWLRNQTVSDSYGEGSVADLLQRLPHRQRGCVLLIHGYGWTYKQTAETLDLPLTTVTNEATRGMQKLRAAMKSDDATSRTPIAHLTDPAVDPK